MAAGPSAHREGTLTNINVKMSMSVIKMNRNKEHKRSLLNRPLFFWGRLLLGVVFILASVDKILHPAVFAKAVYDYQILPDEIINLTAIVLPWLELILGSFLIAGAWLSGCIVLCNLLLVTFFSALVFNVVRGLDIHCGCFTTNPIGEPATIWYLIRDLAFLVLGIYLLFKGILQDQDKVHSKI